MIVHANRKIMDAVINFHNSQHSPCQHTTYHMLISEYGITQHLATNGVISYYEIADESKYLLFLLRWAS